MVRADRVIPAVLAQVLRDAPLCPEKVEFAWRSAVGAAISRATTVRLDADGVLHIAVDNAQWGREIRRSSRLILARMAALLGTGVVRTLNVD